MMRIFSPGRAIGIVLAAALIAGPARAQAPAPLKDLGYAVQSSKAVYLSARHEGKPVNMIREGALGEGRLIVFSGPLNDRVRLTIDDSKGLQEILAMDRGQRITVRRVGDERIEYRLYAPGRKFLIGSVLYRKKNQWLQGLMKTEAFGGYEALADVSDVTGKVRADTPVAGMPVGAWLARGWNSFHIIAPAYAEEENLIKGFFSQSATDARERWSAPMREMVKGSVVGAGAFTVKLIGQSIGYAETAAAGSAIVAAAPFLVAVGTGVAIGLAAEKVYNWADGKKLTGTTSLRELMNRLTADTRYTREAPPAVPADTMASSPASAAPASTAMASFDLLNMSDQLDKLDKRDFRIAMDLADLCTRRRDLSCAAEQIALASKSANSNSDRQQLAQARSNVEATRERIAQEERAREEAERRAEQERIAQLERQRREEEAQSNSGFQWGKAASLLAGTAAGGLNKLAAEKRAEVLTSIVKDSMPGQEGMSNTTRSLTPAAPVRSSGGVRSTASVAAMATKTAVAEVWGEHRTSRETASGRVTEYEESQNIPGDVIRSRVGSRSSAQSVWQSGGGNVSEYSGCGACGVGSTIRITVRFDGIVDYHTYTRLQ
jgi:hypothetical protein